MRFIERWEAQWLGLTEREAGLLLACSNGVTLHHVGDRVVQNSAGCAEYLAAHVAAAAGSSVADHEAFGISLDFPEGDTAETPMEHHDLAEKIVAMTDEQALCLIWWITGYWDGIDQAEGEHTEGE